MATEKKKAGRPAADEKPGLKVNPSTHATVIRIAAMRGVTVAELLSSRDVEDFFNHLLLVELQKATEQLQVRNRR